MSYSISFVRWFMVVMVLLLSACGGADSGNPDDGDNGGDGGNNDDGLTSYTLSGTVEGLAGTGLVLQINDKEYAVTTNGDFNLSIRVAAGTAYEVSVLKAPTGPNQNCTISPSEGVLTADITDILLRCRNNPFFVGFDGSVADGGKGFELWQTDGTEAGTRLVKDINPDGDSSPSDMIDVEGILYFSADDGNHGRELWRSDGTAEGTYRVKDIYGDGVRAPSNFTVFKGELYFWANAGGFGVELWRSDGTMDGTQSVRRIDTNDNNLPAGGKVVSDLTVFHGALFFNVVNDTKIELRTTAGAVDGDTALVTTFAPHTNHLTSFDMTVFNDALYFPVDDGESGTELWRLTWSDNIVTERVADINDGNDGSESSSPSNLTVYNGKLYFSATDGKTGIELWRSYGTGSEAVTEQVKDIRPGQNNSSDPSDFMVFDGMLYFQATDGGHGRELWRSDGTEGGTQLFKDINDGDGRSHSRPRGLNVVNGALCFAAKDVVHGEELWCSDGRAEGTNLLKDINEEVVNGSNQSSNPVFRLNHYVKSQEPQFFSDGSLLFRASDGIHGMELWKTNGTAEGTVLIKDVNQGTGAGVFVNY